MRNINAKKCLDFDLATHDGEVLLASYMKENI
jgi:hypothetical protein